MQLWVSTRKGLFQYALGENGGVTLETSSFVGDPVSLVHHNPRDGTVWAALNLGHFGAKLQRSTDGGKTWTERPMPALPEKPESLDDVDPIRGDDRDWSVSQVWALATGGADQPGRWWCGTIPGGLFKTDDDGETWQLVESLWNDPRRQKWFGGGADQPGIHSICVHPRDSRRVLIGVSCGGVWQTTDDGQTWTNTSAGMRANFVPPEQQDDPDIQDPHLVSQCRDYPDRLWCQHHNAMYRSDDGGHTWTDLGSPAPSHFGFAVAAHPSDPDTAWFVPAESDDSRVPVDGRVVVNRTEDGGKTFETIDSGLPEAPAWDLFFRHALDVGPSGQTLAIGSTTGGLWLSRSGGDHWDLVSAHLPPVYCVHLQP